jgi:hypothetical protein
MKIFAFSLIGLAVACGALAADERSNANITRWSEGKVEYRKISTGEVSGSEDWHITVHPDGSRTLETRNRLDLAGYQRHVMYRVAETFRPLDVTAVYWVKGEWRGTGLFAVTGNNLEAIVNTPDGLIRQTRMVPDQFSFIPHPLQSNAWHTWYYDRAKGGKQTTTVYDMDPGAQAASSMLGKVYTQTIEYLGTEEMTVPAGTFTVDRFNIDNAVDIYLTGPDRVLVRFLWTPADADYVLVEYRDSGS